MWIAICGVHTAESLFTRLIFFTFHCAFGSEVVLETRVLVSRRLEDKNESLGLEHLVLVSVLKKKVLQFFKTFVGNSWRQWARHTMAFCEGRTTEAVCHLEAIVWENLLRSMHTSLSWEVFNNGGYLLGHTDASKAHCIDCGKLLSLGSNKPGKQTDDGLKSCLVKNTTKYTVHEESGIPSTRTTCKKGETGRGIGGA